MGNMQCLPEDAAHLASVARDICPFPNYNPSPLFFNMLSANSSRPLSDHYTAVRSSLTPKQLEDFTLGLKTTFGRGGNVTYGGIGVVALSLAVLFDTLAKQVRGEWVSDAGPIPDLFVKDLRGYYPPHVYTISRYLRMVPHIANNPTRMKEETERYITQLITDDQSLAKLGENSTIPVKEDVTVLNRMLGAFFSICLKIHLRRITNATGDQYRDNNSNSDDDVIINLNCDAEAADKEFLDKVQSDKNTREAFERCQPKYGPEPKSWLKYVAKLEFIDIIFLPFFEFGNNAIDSLLAQSEDFDLKADALKN